MQVSPPITILAMMAALVASTVWLAPPPREAAQVTVVLPIATHQKLVLWGKEHAGADGRPLTIAQVIEELVDKWKQDNEVPANNSAPRVR